MLFGTAHGAPASPRENQVSVALGEARQHLECPIEVLLDSRHSDRDAHRADGEVAEAAAKGRDAEAGAAHGVEAARGGGWGEAERTLGRARVAEAAGAHGDPRLAE